MVVKQILLRDQSSPRRKVAASGSLGTTEFADKKPSPGQLDSLPISAF